MPLLCADLWGTPEDCCPGDPVLLATPALHPDKKFLTERGFMSIFNMIRKGVDESNLILTPSPVVLTRL